MASTLYSLQYLPLELIYRIADELIGIKQWETHEPLPKWTNEFAPPVRQMDFIGLRTLPSLAITSHLFLEPALDALWGTLPSYGILVHVLPRNAWAVRTVHGSDEIPEEERSPPVHYVSVTRTLTENELERVEYYTPRVKRIQERCPLFPCHLSAYIRYESSVLAAFAPRWSPATPLFPNLRELEISPTHEDQSVVYYRFFHILFGHRLRRISNDYTSVSYPGEEKVVPQTDYQQMLTRLQESAPHLWHLTLYADAPPYSPTIISAMSTAIRSFKHLVSVRTGSLPITEQAFRHLAQLPHLEAIDVRLPDDMTQRDVSALCLLRYDDFFPNLRELWLAHRSNLAVISYAVSHIRSSRLESIRAQLLDHRVLIPFDDAMPFLHAVLLRSNSANIKELSIEASIEETDEPTSAFSKEHLEPFFALRSLTHLELRIRCLFNLDDAVLRRAAHSWPRIEVLELGPGVQKDTQVTLSALIPFAQHCPRLHTLSFELDAELSKLDTRDAHADTSQRELRDLEVGRARISDAKGVAAFLMRLFPRLRYVHSDNVPMIAIYPAIAPAPLPEEAAEEARHADYWRDVKDFYVLHMTDWNQTLDEADADEMKSWGPRRLP